MPPKGKGSGGKRKKNVDDDDSLLEVAMNQAVEAAAENANKKKKESSPKKSGGRSVVEVPPGFTSKEEFFAARRMDFEEIRQAAEQKQDSGDPDGALALLKVGCAKSDAPAAMFMDLGAHYQQRRMDEESVEPYRRCIELDPLCIRAAQYLADQLRSFGKKREAEIYLRNAMLSLKAPRFRRQVPDDNYYRLMKRLLITRLNIRSNGGAVADQLTHSLVVDLKEVLEHLPEDPEAFQVLGNYYIDFANESTRRFKILSGMDQRSDAFQPDHGLLPALDENGDPLEEDLLPSEEFFVEGSFERMRSSMRTGIEYHEAALKATYSENGKKQRDLDQVVSFQPKGRKKGDPKMVVNNPEGSFYAAEMVFERIREKLKFSIATSKKFLGEGDAQELREAIRSNSDPRGLRTLAYEKFRCGISSDEEKREALKYAEDGTKKSMEASRWATAQQCLQLSIRITFSQDLFGDCVGYGNQLVELEDKLKRGTLRKEFPTPGFECLDTIQEFAAMVEGYHRTSLWKCAVIGMFGGNLSMATEQLSTLRYLLLRDEENSPDDVHAFDQQCLDITTSVAQPIFASQLRELKHHYNELSLGPRSNRTKEDSVVEVDTDDDEDDMEETPGTSPTKAKDTPADRTPKKSSRRAGPSLEVQIRDLEIKEVNIRGYVGDELGRFLKKFTWQTRNLPKRECVVQQQQKSPTHFVNEATTTKDNFCQGEVFSKLSKQQKRSIDEEDKASRDPVPTEEQIATLYSLLQSSGTTAEVALDLLKEQLAEVPILFPSAFCNGSEVHFTRAGKPIIVPLHEIVPQLVNLSHPSAGGELVVSIKRLRRITTEAVKFLLELLLVACDRGYVPERGLRRAPMKTFDVKINGIPSECMPSLPAWLPSSASSSPTTTNNLQGIIEVRPEAGMSLRFWGLNSDPSEARLRFVALEGFHKRRKDVVYQFSEVAAYPSS